jgi:hypothetical protein
LKFWLGRIMDINLENQMLLFSHYVAEIEDKSFMTIAPEYCRSKVWRLSNNLWSGGVQLWSDDKQSDGFIRRDAEKNRIKIRYGINLQWWAIGVLKIGTKKSANYLNNYIRIFQRLEVFIGSELNRKAWKWS